MSKWRERKKSSARPTRSNNRNRKKNGLRCTTGLSGAKTKREMVEWTLDMACDVFSSFVFFVIEKWNTFRCVFVLINLHRSTRHLVGSFPWDTTANDPVHAARDCVFVERPLILVRPKLHLNIEPLSILFCCVPIQVRHVSAWTLNHPCHNRGLTIELNIWFLSMIRSCRSIHCFSFSHIARSLSDVTEIEQ